MSGQQKVAIVTGGSRGIGAAISRALAAEGHWVHLVYQSAAAAASDVAAKIAADGYAVTVHQADVGAEAEVARLIRDVQSAAGRIDVLVNNAGVINDRLLARRPSLSGRECSGSISPALSSCAGRWCP